MTEPKKPARSRKKRILLIILIVILSLIVILAVTAVITFRRLYNRTTFVDDAEVEATVGTLPPEEEEQVVVLESDVEESLKEAMSLTEPESADEKNEDAKTADPAGNKIYNVLLIGVDRRDRTWNGNSDAMILITVHHFTGKIYMTSFMRDLYSNIEGVGVRKLNHAYAIGAGPLLVKTLQTNYGVAIDHYASVDFFAMEDIIDICGGVTITIKDYELPTMRYHGITEAGTYLLNGEQALAYSRIRHQGNADFERTSRQRTVLQALFQKARSMGAMEAARFANDLLPYITHNLSAGDTLDVLTDLPRILKYDVEEIRIPYDGEFHIVNELLVPNDINNMVSKLRSTIYAAE